MKEKEYIALRKKYTPKKIKTVFILESPPAGDAYFYNHSGKVSEILFRSFMQLMKIKPKTKSEGLQEFSNRGWIVVDPIYVPVNKLPDKEADRMILGNYPNFIQDLKSLGVTKEIPIVIVKANVLKILEDKMLEDGFNVINKKLMIPFPLHYHYKTFEERINSLLRMVKS